MSINSRICRSVATLTICQGLLAVAFMPSLGAQDVAPGAASRRVLTVEQWRQDLDSLMSNVRLQHKNMYHTTSAATFDSAVKALHDRIPRLARHEIIAEMMKLVALVGDGHTNIYPTRDTVIAFRTLPVAFYPFSDGWFIRSAHRDHAGLVGARVISIGGQPVETAFERSKAYVGRDNDMGALYWGPYLLAMPEMLHAMRLSPSPDSARFELEVGGSRRIVWLKPHGPVPMTPSDTDVSPWPRSGWVDARERASATPLWLRHRPDTTMWWFEKIPGTRVGYAQISQVRNATNESFADFTNRLLHFTDTARLERLVIDLRLNRGGNGTLLDPLKRGLLKRPHINARGKLFVITSRITWSAAQFFVNDMAEFSEAIFVGEPSASRGNAYGDSRQIRLPHSGITARASIYYWQDWHPLDRRPWVAVEVAAVPSSADYREGRDVALAAAMSHEPLSPLAERMKQLAASGDTVIAVETFKEYMRDPAHRYVDGLRLLRQVALSFYNRSDIPRATWAFALAAREYPDAIPAQQDAALMFRQSGQRELERKALQRILELDSGNVSARERLRTL